MSNNKETFNYIKNFLEADGISGFEREISKKYIEVAKNANWKIERDGFGSVIAIKGNQGPKLMLATHMDEVGFLITKIEKEGFLRVSALGGIWSHTIPSMRVKVRTRKGVEYKGVMGSTSVHMLNVEDRTKMIKPEDHFIDIGVKSADEVKALGIDVGDEVIRIGDAFLMANDDRFCCKAVDNRIGVAITAKILERLKDQDIPCTVYAVATAQEEVGSRGAKVAAQKINPDVALALDTCTSNDTPKLPEGVNVLGAGAAITIADAYYIANPMLCDRLMEVAKTHKIPAYRYVSTAGGNDSEMTQWVKGGIPVVTIGTPTRYMHTTSEVGSIADFNAIVDLVVEFIKSFTSKVHKSMLYGE